MPEKSAPVSQALAVSVVEVQPEDVPVTLTGYGEVAVLNTVALSAEVAGTLVYVNPKLEPGELLSKGEVVFRIDNVRYTTAAAALAAVVSRLENRICELEIRHGINQERLAIARKNRELAGTEFSRLETLFHKHRVGSRSDLDRAEQVLNTSRDLAARLSQVVRFNPGTRTLVLAVRVGPEPAGPGQAGEGRAGPGQGTGLPLVEGMFCRVEIPGRTMEKVFRLPGPAVGFDKQVCVSDNGRLKTVPVEVIRVQGDETFVRARVSPDGRGAGTSPDDRRTGLNPGDRVIVTPLANPVDNTALIHIPVK